MSWVRPAKQPSSGSAMWWTPKVVYGSPAPTIASSKSLSAPPRDRTVSNHVEAPYKAGQDLGQFHGRVSSIVTVQLKLNAV